MKLVNEKGKLFGLVNPIDILAVLGVIAAGLVLAWFLVGGGSRANFDRYIEFTVEVRSSHIAFEQRKESINVGDDVRDTIFGVEIGTVVEIRYRPHTEWVFNQNPNNPQMMEIYFPYYEILYVTIRSSGFDNGRALEIMSPGYEIRMGQEVHFRGMGYQARGFVVELREFPKS